MLILNAAVILLYLDLSSKLKLLDGANYNNSREMVGLLADLNSGFTEARPLGQLLPGEGVRIVGPLEDGLQGLELPVAEGRPVPSSPLVVALEVVQRGLGS